MLKKTSYLTQRRKGAKTPLKNPIPSPVVRRGGEITNFLLRESSEQSRHCSLIENQIAEHVGDAAFRIHRKLGPGLLESVYEAILAYELHKRGLHVSRQVPIPLVYESVRFEEGFYADLIVEGKVIVELKSVEQLHPSHPKQLLTYLRLADRRLGLLINFGESFIKNGMKRVVNGLEE